MSERRVVITGFGLCSPIGHSLDAVSESLQTLRHGIATMPEWDRIGQLATRLAAPVIGVERSQFPRKRIRTMGRVAMLSMFASDNAIAMAGLSARPGGWPWPISIAPVRRWWVWFYPWVSA